MCRRNDVEGISSHAKISSTICSASRTTASARSSALAIWSTGRTCTAAGRTGATCRCKCANEIIPGAALFRTAGTGIAWPGAGAAAATRRERTCPIRSRRWMKLDAAVQDYVLMKPEFIKIWVDDRRAHEDADASAVSGDYRRGAQTQCSRRGPQRHAGGCQGIDARGRRGMAARSRSRRRGARRRNDCDRQGTNRQERSPDHLDDAGALISAWMDTQGGRGPRGSTIRCFATLFSARPYRTTLGRAADENDARSDQACRRGFRVGQGRQCDEAQSRGHENCRRAPTPARTVS